MARMNRRRLVLSSVVIVTAYVICFSKFTNNCKICLQQGVFTALFILPLLYIHSLSLVRAAGYHVFLWLEDVFISGGNPHSTNRF